MTMWTWVMPVVCGLIVVTSIAMILNNVLRKKRSAAAEKPCYRFEDFLEDLKNPAVPIDQVIAKCGGTIPREWEERLSPAPEKASVGPVAAPAVPAALADKAGDRAQARKDWFNKLAVSTPVIPVVPPPAVPPPAPVINGWIIHCKWCTEMRSGNYNPRPFQSGDAIPGITQKRHINPCQYCGGKGMVMITGG